MIYFWAMNFCREFYLFVEGGVSFSDVKHYFDIKRTRTNITTLSNTEYTSSLNFDQYKTGYNVGIGANYLASTSCFFFSEVVYNNLEMSAGPV